MVAGVCAGVGDFFGLDASVVRLIFVLGVVLGFGSFFFLYIILWIILPDEPAGYMPVPPVPPTPPAPPAE
jgi:phage shock protein PspC (stress-responsive transcriptional regulator)